MAQQPPQSMLNKGTLRSYEHGMKELLAHDKIEHLAGQPQQTTKPILSSLKPMYLFYYSMMNYFKKKYSTNDDCD